MFFKHAKDIMYIVFVCFENMLNVNLQAEISPSFTCIDDAHS